MLHVRIHRQDSTLRMRVWVGKIYIKGTVYQMKVRKADALVSLTL